MHVSCLLFQLGFCIFIDGADRFCSVWLIAEKMQVCTCMCVSQRKKWEFVNMSAQFHHHTIVLSLVAKAIKCLLFPSWTVVQNNKNNRKQLKFSVLFNVFDNIFPRFYCYCKLVPLTLVPLPSRLQGTEPLTLVVRQHTGRKEIHFMERTFSLFS